MELMEIFKGYSLEVILIAVGAFLLTYLLKLPIKKATAKLDEDKRKMVNIVILAIPFLICFIAGILYWGVARGQWFSEEALVSSASAFLLSLSLYAVVSRIWLVIKGIISGKENSELSKETIAYIKENIKALLKKVKLDKKELDSVLSELEKLETQKNLISADTVNLDLSRLAYVNGEIGQLSNKKASIEAEIADCEEKAKKYESQLKGKEV